MKEFLIDMLNVFAICLVAELINNYDLVILIGVACIFAEQVKGK